jgi:hypothetical protein
MEIRIEPPNNDLFELSNDLIPIGIAKNNIILIKRINRLN